MLLSSYLPLFFEFVLSGPLAPTPTAALVLQPASHDQGAPARFSAPDSRFSSGGARGQRALTEEYAPYSGGRSAAELVYPGGAARNIPSRNIHSHNDYWRDVPLYTALANGVRSIEADVWLNPRDQKLYVGHNYLSLTRARTFTHLYVDQLVKILEDVNVRDDDYDFFNSTNYFSPENVEEPRRSFEPFFDDGLSTIQLLVDLKTRGKETYEAVMRETQPLRRRGWLAHWDGAKLVPGPIQVILTGNGANPDVRAIIPTLPTIDAFMDAPLLSLHETWTGVDGKEYGWNSSTNAPLASASFDSVTSWTGRQPITNDELERLTAVFSSAQALGFKTRAYSPPRWPTHVRNRVWTALFEAGTDFLDSDDLEDMAAF